MRRTKEDAARTREQVLEAALRVFSERGYSAASLAEIASTAGVTRGAIYWHFDSKAGLYNTLLAEMTSPIRTIVEEEASVGGSVAEVLRRIFVRQLVLVESDRRLRAMMELALFKTEVSDDLRPGRNRRIRSGQEMLRGLADVIRDGVRSGGLRADLDPDSAARVFIALQNGLVQLWLASPKAFSLKRTAPDLVDVLMRGMQTSD